MKNENHNNKKFGKNHDKNNCKFCKGHKKHPNNERKEYPVKKEEKKGEGLGYIPKFLKIAKGIMFDVCGHKDDGEKYSFYKTDIANCRWVRINGEKDAFNKADIVWSYERDKFVKDTHGIMETIMLFADGFTSRFIQSRFDDKKYAEYVEKREKAVEDAIHKMGYTPLVSASVRNGKVVRHYTFDYANGTFTNNMTGETKKISEMTEDERRATHFRGEWKKDEPTAITSKADDKKEVVEVDGNGEVIDKMAEVSHRLKSELDEAREQNKKLKVCLQSAMARLKAFEGISEFKDVAKEVDAILFDKKAKAEEKKNRSWKTYVFGGLWNLTKIAAFVSLGVTSLIGAKLIFSAVAH